MEYMHQGRMTRRTALGGVFALSGALSGNAVGQMPVLLAIAPAVVAGIFSLLSANVSARKEQRNESNAAEDRYASALRDRQRLERMLLQEYLDRAWYGRPYAIERWLQPEPIGNFGYKIAFEPANRRPLTVEACSAFQEHDLRLGFEDGLVRLDRNSTTHYMHGGELQAATDWLRTTGRMPTPLDEAAVLPSKQARPFREKLAQINGLEQPEFDARFSIFGSRPYSGDGKATSYWLHSVVHVESHNAGRPQNVGFIETT